MTPAQSRLMASLSDLRDLLAREDPRAVQTLDSLLGFERDAWVCVYRRDDRDTGGEYRIACLLRPAAVEEALRQPSFGFEPGDGRPGFVGQGNGAGGWNVEYVTIGSEEVVPLVFERYFRGPFPNVIELAEDFRLFWDLYEDRTSGVFLTTDELGDQVTVAEWRGGELWVSKRYLRRYQAARQLALSLQVTVDRRGGAEIAHLETVEMEVEEDGVNLVYHGGSGMMVDAPNFTRLLGKRVIPPPPIEQSGVWPYESRRQFESFIIGTDGEGEPVLHSCNPGLLANYFGKNPEAPHYLTPVFFDRAVLEKYYADPDRYEVEDGYLRASGAWGLRMDNALPDHVVVFLGDLGSDIPHREQKYWRSYNITPAGPMSETAIRRSFLGQFFDSEHVEHRFTASYARLNEVWESRFGWPLWKPLHEGDAHLAHTVHVPTNRSFGQFDDQIGRLAKLVVDSLNEEQIVAATQAPAEGAKGIAKLERLLQELDIESEPVCATLRQIQGARSRSAAHRKGKDFDPTVLLAGTADLRALFNQLLEQLVDHIGRLAAQVASA